MAVEPKLGDAEIASAIEISRASSGICESICGSTPARDL